MRRGNHRRLQERDPRRPLGKLTEAAAAFYEKPRQVGAQDAIGAAIANAMKNRVVEVWPENWEAFCIFADLQTQWRVGFGGETGLDYGVLYRDLDDLGITGPDRLLLKADIRAMEQAALKAMHGDENPQ
jgi:hypothetical protein